jgi:lipopolysaccharide transport system permease protein
LVRRVTYIRSPEGAGSFDLSELWEQRDLLRLLIWRDLKVRYAQTLVGVAWCVIQPVLAMGIFSVVFGQLVGIPSGGIPYPLLSLSGIIIWGYFNQVVAASSTSVTSHQQMIEKTYFPRIFIPLAVACSGVVDLGIAGVLLGVVMVIFSQVPSANLMLLALALLITIVSAFGMGCLLGALNVRYRDVKYLVPFLMQLWLFSTPIVFPSDLVPENWRIVLAINPLAGAVEAFRTFLFGHGAFSSFHFVISTTSGILLMAAGLYVFKRMESRFSDVI